jgi:hypothetical protein
MIAVPAVPAVTRVSGGIRVPRLAPLVRGMSLVPVMGRVATCGPRVLVVRRRVGAR